MMGPFARAQALLIGPHTSTDFDKIHPDVNVNKMAGVKKRFRFGKVRLIVIFF